MSTTTTSTITVIVYSPNHTDPKRFTWSTGHTLGRAAIEAAEAFGLFVGQTKPTFRNQAGELLDITASLAEAGVQEGDKLDLVTSGGGV
jgi:hypothetical protein